MGTFFVILILVVIIVFIIWFLPKAFKGWNVSWGSGFARVYYVLASIITFFIAVSIGTEDKGDFDFFGFLIMWALLYLIAFLIFKTFTWVFGAFIKKKK